MPFAGGKLALQMQITQIRILCSSNMSLRAPVPMDSSKAAQEPTLDIKNLHRRLESLSHAPEIKEAAPEWGRPVS
jgi:hypothetical protein